MNMTYTEAYEGYVKYAEVKLKPQSVYKIISRFENHILPFFGNMKIKDITPFIYLKWQAELETKGYSFKYKKTLHYCNVALFNYLMLFCNIRENIPSKVGNFKNKYEIDKKFNYWTYDEFEKFISVSDNLVYETLFKFLFFTGCRLGEALALNFDDINGDMITINKTITKEFHNGKRIITTPKTKKSIREIRIDSKLANEIQQLKLYYNTRYKKFNNYYFIFGGIKPLAPTSVGRYKDKYCNLSNVRNIRIHDLRHSHTTLLLTNEVPIKDVSERLGHSDITFTLNIYAHVINDEQKRVINTLDYIRSREPILPKKELLI